MRILIDTNIIISALLFPHSNVAKVLLYVAASADVEIILTGDKDFLSLDIKKPKCMSVKEFSTKYM